MKQKNIDRIISKNRPTIADLEAVGKHLRIFKEPKSKKQRPPPIIRWSTKRNDAGVFAALEALRQAGRKILVKRQQEAPR